MRNEAVYPLKIPSHRCSAQGRIRSRHSESGIQESEDLGVDHLGEFLEETMPTTRADEDPGVRYALMQQLSIVDGIHEIVIAVDDERRRSDLRQTFPGIVLGADAQMSR